MRGFIKLLLIIVLGGYLALFLLDWTYTWTITQRPLLNIKENRNYDYLIAGDSRTNPLVAPYIDLKTGLKTINIGYPAFTLDDNQRILQYFFNRGNRVERVLLQMDLRFGTAAVGKQEWYYWPYLHRQSGILSAELPFSYYARENKNITLKTLGSGIKYLITVGDGESKLDTAEINNDFRPFLYNKKLLKDYSKEPFKYRELIEFNAFLKKNGVRELIFFKAPCTPEWFESQTDTSTYKQKLRGMGFKYFDLSGVYSDTSYFKDYTHIKNNRYLEFSRYFIHRVIDTLELKDRQLSVAKSPMHPSSQK
jgi:hypothetical protein